MRRLLHGGTGPQHGGQHDEGCKADEQATRATEVERKVHTQCRDPGQGDGGAGIGEVGQQQGAKHAEHGHRPVQHGAGQEGEGDCRQQREQHRPQGDHAPPPAALSSLQSTTAVSSSTPIRVLRA